MTEHEAGLHSCGHPQSLAFSPDAEGWYEVGSATCQACAAMELHRQAHSGGTEPGTTAMVTFAAGPDDRITPWNGRLTVES